MTSHQISETLKEDFQKVIDGPHLREFEKRNEYKSAKTRKADEALVKFLIDKLNSYKNGWVAANACQTLSLKTLHNQVEADRQTIDKALSAFNDLLNRFIASIAHKIPAEKLGELRGLEMEYRKIKQSTNYEK